MRATQLGENEVHIDVTQVQPEKQVVSTQHVVLTEQGTRFYPVKLRYIWHTEMDLMARLAHLQLKERWGDWRKSRFTFEGGKHISVYEHEK